MKAATEARLVPVRKGRYAFSNHSAGYVAASYAVEVRGREVGRLFRRGDSGWYFRPEGGAAFHVATVFKCGFRFHEVRRAVLAYVESH